MTLFYILLTLSAFVYLAETNPKRRRAFNQPPIRSRKWVWPARIAVIFPAVIMIVFQDWSALSIWAGAVTVIGWIIAAVSPVTLIRAIQFGISFGEEIYSDLSRKTAHVRIRMFSYYSLLGGTQRLHVDDSDNRIKELEARIKLLEAKLAKHEAGLEAEAKAGEPPLKIVRGQ